MALTPAFSPIEQLLLNGPHALSAYPGESFSWIKNALAERFCDWNTIIGVFRDFVPERVQNICDMYDELVLGPPPLEVEGEEAPVDKHQQSRHIVYMLRCMSAIAHTASVVSVEAKRSSLSRIAQSLEGGKDRADRRTHYEWVAWFVDMESQLLQTKSAMEHALERSQPARKRPLSEEEPNNIKKSVHSEPNAQ